MCSYVFLEVKYSRNLLEKKRKPPRPRRRIGGKHSKDFLKTIPVESVSTADGCEILHQLIGGKHPIIYRVSTILFVKFHCSNCQSPLLSLPDCVCPQLSLPNCVITRAVLFSLSGSIVRRLKALIQASYTNTIVCALCTWYTSIVFNTVPWFHCRCN